MGFDEKLWQKCVEFHGHQCPGLAIGFKAAMAAKEQMGWSFSADEEIVCVTENDACGVDAIQVLTGCTFGKGNLLYRARGKQAFSFFNRATGEGLRLVLKKPHRKMTREERQQYILNAEAKDLFEFKKPHYKLPERAKLFTTVICEQCGEGVAENKARLSDGKKVCLDCFPEYSRGWESK